VRGEAREVICGPCGLRRELDRVLPADIDGALQPLREAILSAEPLSTRRWLNRCHQLLADLHHGRIALDHAALDALSHRRSVEYLRALMISTAILPPDPGRELRRLEADLPDTLRGLDDRDRRIATLWVRWAVLHRLRRLDDEHALAVSVKDARRKIAKVIAFTAGLEHAGRELAVCTQADVDSWFAGPGASRWVLRPFLVWAIGRRHLPAHLSLPPAYQGKPCQPVDSEQRWKIARALVSDESITAPDRVAGALVVLYAQPVTRIVKLTTAHVTTLGDRVELCLGPDPLTLPEPFASLIRTLPRKRREGTAEQLPTQNLFPGGHAGQPMTTRALSIRLRAIGIEPRRMRLAAAEQLSREIPPAMLAGVLGLKAATVARTTTRTGGQWSNYPADHR
jgi:hypothetical protein